MPIIIPPPLLDAPAIVRSAAHSPARPIPAQRPLTPSRPVQQPDGGAQGPEIVSPVSPLPPPPGAATSQGAPSQTNAERRGR